MVGNSKRAIRIGSIVCGMVFAAALACAPAAQAASFTYDLTCPFGGGPTAPQCGGFDYGDITFTDVAGGVSVTVDLTNDSWTIGEILWNSSSDPTGILTSSVPTLTIAFNAINDLKADGYQGLFDIKLNPGSGTFASPFMFTLTGAGASATLFNSLDSLGLVFAAIHIQACGADTTNCPAGSIWVGATSTNGGGGGQSPVPEPASLLLVGAGLFFGAWRVRRRTAR